MDTKSIHSSLDDVFSVRGPLIDHHCQLMFADGYGLITVERLQGYLCMCPAANVSWQWWSINGLQPTFNCDEPITFSVGCSLLWDINSITAWQPFYCDEPITINVSCSLLWDNNSITAWQPFYCDEPITISVCCSLLWDINSITAWQPFYCDEPITINVCYSLLWDVNSITA